MEVSLDVHDASRHGENGTGGDLGRARLDEYIIKCRDDGVVDGILSQVLSLCALLQELRTRRRAPGGVLEARTRLPTVPETLPTLLRSLRMGRGKVAGNAHRGTPLLLLTYER